MRLTVSLALLMQLLVTATAHSQSGRHVVEIPAVADMDTLALEKAVQANTENLLYEVSPQRLTPAEWETKVSIVHSPTHLVIRVDAYDPDIQQIAAQQVKHDGSLGSDDSIIVSISNPPDARRAYAFQANAAGSTADYISSSAGERAPDWNGKWDATVTVAQDRYVATFTIPFATLGIAASPNAIDIGLNVERQIGRGRAERLSLAPVNSHLPCVECQFQSRRLGANTLAETQSAMLRIQPYALATRSRQSNPATGERISSQSNGDAGVDVTWMTTPRDTLVATLNPDFSQVEIDSVQFQINKRFVRSLPERRAFFTNEASVFNSSLPLLHTRSIVDPLAGLQYVRRRDSYDFGAMLVRDEVTSFILPSEETSSLVSLGKPSTNFVSRYNYRPSPGLRAAASVFSREAGEYRNSVGSADSTWTINSRHQVDFQLAASETCDEPTGSGLDGVECKSGSAGKLLHSFGGDHWFTLAEYTRYDRQFRADQGQLTQVGVEDFFFTASYQRPYSGPLGIERLRFSSSGSRQNSLESGLLHQTGIASVSLSSKRATLTGQIDSGEQSFEGRLFDVGGWQAQWVHRPSAYLNYSATLSGRRGIDYAALQPGTEQSFSGAVVYKPSPQLEARLSLSASRFERDGAEVYSTQTAALRTEYHFNSDHHLTCFLNVGLAEIRGVSRQTALYQLSYQFKPSAFRYFIIGFSGEARGSASLSGFQPASDFVFAKMVMDFDW